MFEPGDIVYYKRELLSQVERTWKDQKIISQDGKMLLSDMRILMSGFQLVDF